MKNIWTDQEILDAAAKLNLADNEELIVKTAVPGTTVFGYYAGIRTTHNGGTSQRGTYGKTPAEAVTNLERMLSEQTEYATAIDRAVGRAFVSVTLAGTGIAFFAYFLGAVTAQ